MIPEYRKGQTIFARIYSNSKMYYPCSFIDTDMASHYLSYRLWYNGGTHRYVNAHKCVRHDLSVLLDKFHYLGYPHSGGKSIKHLSASSDVAWVTDYNFFAFLDYVQKEAIEGLYIAYSSSGQRINIDKDGTLDHWSVDLFPETRKRMNYMATLASYARSSMSHNISNLFFPENLNEEELNNLTLYYGRFPKERKQVTKKDEVLI